MNEAVTMAAVPDARAEALVASYERAGYVRLAPAFLQPAEPFLDLSGEDIRKRMFLTTGPARARAVPAARPHHSGLARLSRLAEGRQAARAICYLGPVFRHQRRGAGEFLQAGIESFGRTDTAATDAEMLALGLEARDALRRRRLRTSAWATSGCSPRWLPRSISRRPGSGGW